MMLTAKEFFASPCAVSQEERSALSPLIVEHVASVIACKDRLPPDGYEVLSAYMAQMNSYEAFQFFFELLAVVNARQVTFTTEREYRESELFRFYSSCLKYVVRPEVDLSRLK